MSQVNIMVVSVGLACLLRWYLQTCPPDLWCMRSSSHGYSNTSNRRNSLLCLFEPDVSPSLFVPHRLLLSVPLKVEARSLLWVSRTLLHLCHQRDSSITDLGMYKLLLKRKLWFPSLWRAQMWTNSWFVTLGSPESFSSPPSVTVFSHVC